jgi:predicted CoA-binding protein
VKTIAVVGMSFDPDRPSFSVAMFMQGRGCKIVPVRPGGGTILGEKVYDKLSDIPFKVDLVDVFRASRFVSAHVDEALAIGAPAIWMQEGVIDDVAAERAKAAGLFVVMDRCVLKEVRKSRAA